MQKIIMYYTVYVAGNWHFEANPEDLFESH